MWSNPKIDITQCGVKRSAPGKFHEFGAGWLLLACQTIKAFIMRFLKDYHVYGYQLLLLKSYYMVRQCNDIPLLFGDNVQLHL